MVPDKPHCSGLPLASGRSGQVRQLFSIPVPPDIATVAAEPVNKNHRSGDATPLGVYRATNTAGSDHNPIVADFEIERP